jgi:hypothetical protein
VSGRPEQLLLDAQVPVQDLHTGVRDLHGRAYWECRGPGVWEEVEVRVRYGPGAGDRGVVLPYVVTGRVAPRNVLVERADGSVAVRPVRVLRLRRPVPGPRG